jgi:hypothetical protein
MRRFQTQRQVVSSQLRHPLPPQEYEEIIEAYWKIESKDLALCGL